MFMRTSKGGWELKLWHFPLSQWLVGSASYELGSSPNIGRELQIGTAKKIKKMINVHYTILFITLGSLAVYTQELYSY